MYWGSDLGNGFSVYGRSRAFTPWLSATFAGGAELLDWNDWLNQLCQYFTSMDMVVLLGQRVWRWLVLHIYQYGHGSSVRTKSMTATFVSIYQYGHRSSVRTKSMTATFVSIYQYGHNRSVKTKTMVVTCQYLLVWTWQFCWDKD